MAKAAFISLYDQSAYGIRLLSACLKKEGHKRHIIFFKGYNSGTNRSDVALYDGEIPWEGIGNCGSSFVYAIGRDISYKEKEILIDLLKNIKPDFIGLTVNTPLKWRAILVSKLIKKHFPDTLLIWGGFEPTINPKDSLQYCDIACIGEAEDTIVELANAIDKNKDIKKIRNLCFNDNGSLLKNGINPPRKDLDTLPFQDCSSEGNFFIESDQLQKSPKFLFPVPKIYSTIAARGCMFKCTYCCELYLQDLYHPHTFLRRRSPENVIEELKEVKSNHDINHIIFQDEVIAYQMDWLKIFSPLYKKSIGLTFTSYVFPTKNFEERIKVLKDAGLSYTCLAVQSGSKSISKLYKRPYNKQLYLEAARILRSMDIGFYTDVIAYNPLEKKDDLESTLDVLLEIPQPYDLCINKLYVLPGTKLYEQLADYEIDKNKFLMFSYYSALFQISSYFKNAKILIRVIKSVYIFSRYPALLKPILYITSLLGSLNTSIYFLMKRKRSGELNISFVRNVIKRKLRLSW